MGLVARQQALGAYADWPAGSMSILVTGGTGFVGIHVLRELAGRGGSVISLATGGSLDAGAQEFLSGVEGRITCREADVRDLDAVRRLIRDARVRVLVHGAAVTAIGSLEAAAAHEAVMVNVGGTATVLEAARLEGVERFMLLSSATVYGSSPPSIPLDEDRALAPQGIYGVTKRAAEEIVSRYFDLFGMTGAILRISTPYGPLERPTGQRTVMSPVYDWCRAALHGKDVALEEDLERDFTHCGDTARCIVEACHAAKLGYRVYNVSSGENFRFSSVLEILSRLRPSFRFRVQNTGVGSGFFRDSLRGPLAIERARNDLGFVPQYDLESGLREYLRWLEKHAA